MRLNPFGFLFEHPDYPHARTLRTGFLEKWMDTFSVWSGVHSLPGVEDQEDELDVDETVSLRKTLSTQMSKEWNQVGLVDWITLFSLKVLLSLLQALSLTLFYGCRSVGRQMETLRSKQQNTNGLEKAGLFTARVLLGMFALAPLALSDLLVSAATLAVGLSRILAVGVLGVASLPFVALAAGVASLVARPYKNRIRNIKLNKIDLAEDGSARSSHATVSKMMAEKRWNFNDIVILKDKDAGDHLVKNNPMYALAEQPEYNLGYPIMVVTHDDKDCAAETEALSALNMLRWG